MTHKIYIEIAGGEVENIYTDLKDVDFIEIDLDIPDADCNMLSGPNVQKLAALDPDVLVIENSMDGRKVRAAKNRLLEAVRE